MHKKYIYISFIISSFIINPLAAATIFHHFTPRQLSQKYNLTPKEKKAVDFKAAESKGESVNNFTDFSGSWVGICDDAEEPETITIKNTKDLFISDGEQFKIGFLETRSDANEDNTSFAHTLLEWNANYSRLLISHLFFNYYHTPYKKEKISGYSNGFIMLKNNQLIIRFFTHSTDENFTSTCTYNKV